MDGRRWIIGPSEIKISLCSTFLRCMVASIATIIPFVACQQYSYCDAISYYSAITDLTNRDQLHSHIQNTHRTSLPYSSSSRDDVWDALAALDSDDSGENLLLVYGDKYVPVAPRDGGTCEYWNREHLWPRSHGVGESGYDNTDLHHIRPADCNVNLSRSNRYFGSCSSISGVSSSSECISPAHSEAASDTQRNGDVFLPPANQRGDIARAIFYMDLRYDGDDESNVVNLVVTDCPEELPESSMGYLSQLLQWHMDDPPDEREQERNDSICKSETLFAEMSFASCALIFLYLTYLSGTIINLFVD